MSKIPGYTGLTYPLYSPIEAVTATCTAPYNHRAIGFRNCDSAFHLASTILGGRDVIEEFVAAGTWPISHGWAPTESAFHLASTILGGCDVIEEFVAAGTWPISHGWAPTEIFTFNVNWAMQEVPFPRFSLQLKEGQTAKEFME
jgi:hypothetical protein